MDKICDIAIIGSGPAGYTSALRFAKSGKKVIVIEKDKIGGTCLNSGCIPTKFLWQAAKTKQKILKSCDYAIKAKLEPVNFEEIILKKNKAIENLSKGVMHLFENSKIDFVNGNASFKTQHQLLVKTEKEEIHITADKIVIASGSKPKPVGNFNFDHKKYIDSTDALNLISVPKNMLIIGSGAIGVEFGSIFASFGCEITLREIMPQILPEEDFELAEEVKKNLLRQGVKVETSSKDPFKNEQMFEKVLIAAGRQSLSDGLNVSNIGLKTDKRNYIVSQAYSTNIENIFAIGDAAGNNFLAYTAEQDGISLVSKLSGKYIDKKNDPVPKVVFSFPPAASVKHYDFDKYKNISYGKINFISNARAQIEFEKTGWVKAAVDKDSGKILGIWIIGENADELINTASVIIKAAMTPDDLSKNMFFHPGLSEIIFDACESAAVKNDSL